MAFSATNFSTASLREHARGEAVARILAAAVNAVEAGPTIRRAVRREGDRLTIRGQHLNLRDFRRVAVISIGKAALGMAEAVEEILGDRFDDGIIVAKHADRPQRSRFAVMAGGHPVPDESSVLAGERVLELAAALTKDDLLLCLISGGGSALVSVPVEGVSLPDLQALTEILLACGASVEEMNSMRRLLDRIKGGGLAEAANGAHVVTLILSDVIGNPLEAIASGPTVPNPTTAGDALAVLEKYQLTERIPASITSALCTPAQAMSEAGDSSLRASQPQRQTRPDPDRGDVHVIASNLQALQAALTQAEAEGFHPYLLRADLQGEAREAGLDLAAALRWERQRADPVRRPACLVAGGETTVTLRGQGQGGRNTELALASAIDLADFPDVMLVTLATDGEDGPTDAAGAVVVGDTFERARALGLDASDFLRRNDSYTFFAALDDLLKPGPTGTNVNDMVLMFAFAGTQPPPNRKEPR